MTSSWTFPDNAVKLWLIPSAHALATLVPWEEWCIESRRDDWDVYYAKCEASSVREQTAEIVMLGRDAFETKEAAIEEWRRRMALTLTNITRRLQSLDAVKAEG